MDQFGQNLIIVPTLYSLPQQLMNLFKWDFGCRTVWGKWHLSRKCSWFGACSPGQIYKSFFQHAILCLELNFSQRCLCVLSCFKCCFGLFLKEVANFIKYLLWRNSLDNSYLEAATQEPVSFLLLLRLKCTSTCTFKWHYTFCL